MTGKPTSGGRTTVIRYVGNAARSVRAVGIATVRIASARVQLKMEADLGRPR